MSTSWGWPFPSLSRTASTDTGSCSGCGTPSSGVPWAVSAKGDSSSNAACFSALDTTCPSITSAADTARAMNIAVSGQLQYEKCAMMADRYWFSVGASCSTKSRRPAAPRPRFSLHSWPSVRRQMGLYASSAVLEAIVGASSAGAGASVSFRPRMADRALEVFTFMLTNVDSMLACACCTWCPMSSISSCVPMWMRLPPRYGM
mmetsp:Transcript_46228/g.118028  ORF Transcript_46228/g.118028 Transcript_46228/m.118028 type:complete len:203 (-) Transcript_46228:2069-2677(-)